MQSSASSSSSSLWRTPTNYFCIKFAGWAGLINSIRLDDAETLWKLERLCESVFVLRRRESYSHAGASSSVSLFWKWTIERTIYEGKLVSSSFRNCSSLFVPRDDSTLASSLSLTLSLIVSKANRQRLSIIVLSDRSGESQVPADGRIGFRFIVIARLKQCIEDILY